MPEAQPHPPVVQGDSDPCLIARLFDQLSLATHAWVRVPSGLTSSPGQHALVSVGPWGQPYLPCDIGPGPSARGVDQQSLAYGALF